jgi:hypothetical protein
MELLSTALPPDVRKWLCPSENGPRVLGAASRGHTPENQFGTNGRAKPLQQIKQ